MNKKIWFLALAGLAASLMIVGPVFADGPNGSYFVGPSILGITREDASDYLGCPDGICTTSNALGDDGYSLYVDAGGYLYLDHTIAGVLVETIRRGGPCSIHSDLHLYVDELATTHLRWNYSRSDPRCFPGSSNWLQTFP